jgi:hypothetical protein
MTPGNLFDKTLSPVFLFLKEENMAFIRQDLKEPANNVLLQMHPCLYPQFNLAIF